MSLILDSGVGTRSNVNAKDYDWCVVPYCLLCRDGCCLISSPPIIEGDFARQWPDRDRAGEDDNHVHAFSAQDYPMKVDSNYTVIVLADL